jgi:hypothetical protein
MRRKMTVLFFFIVVSMLVKGPVVLAAADYDTSVVDTRMYLKAKEEKEALALTTAAVSILGPALLKGALGIIGKKMKEAGSKEDMVVMAVSNTLNFPNVEEFVVVHGEFGGEIDPSLPKSPMIKFAAKKLGCSKLYFAFRGSVKFAQEGKTTKNTRSYYLQAEELLYHRNIKRSLSTLKRDVVIQLVISTASIPDSEEKQNGSGDDYASAGSSDATPGTSVAPKHALVFRDMKPKTWLTGNALKEKVTDLIPLLQSTAKSPVSVSAVVTETKNANPYVLMVGEIIEDKKDDLAKLLEKKE